jgi:hypothetical protein
MHADYSSISASIRARSCKVVVAVFFLAFWCLEQRHALLGSHPGSYREIYCAWTRDARAD